MDVGLCVASSLLSSFFLAAWRTKSGTAQRLSKVQQLPIEEATKREGETLAVRGVARADDPIQCTFAKNDKAIVYVYQHIRERNQRTREIDVLSELVRSVPFKVDDGTGNIGVDDAQKANLRGLTVVFDQFEPAPERGVIKRLVDELLGERLEGYRKVERALTQGSIVTVIGEVESRKGGFHLRKPLSGDADLYYVSDLTKEEIVRSEMTAARWSLVFGILTGGIAVGILVSALAQRGYITKFRKWLQSLLPENTVSAPVDSSNNSSTCLVCMERDRDIIFQPCGHLCSCHTCAFNMVKCPVCRHDIVSSQRIYPS